MAEFKALKQTYIIELTHDEVSFIKNITQNQIHDFPLPLEKENAENIFNAMRDALENENEHL